MSSICSNGLAAATLSCPANAGHDAAQLRPGDSIEL